MSVCSFISCLNNSKSNKNVYKFKESINETNITINNNKNNTNDLNIDNNNNNNFSNQ